MATSNLTPASKADGLVALLDQITTEHDDDDQLGGLLVAALALAEDLEKQLEAFETDIDWDDALTLVKASTSQPRLPTAAEGGRQIQ